MIVELIAMSANKKSNKELTIHPEWCKGCNICVEFCPRNVLVLEKGKIVIANPLHCVYCGICEKLCPDYAVYMVLEDKEPEFTVS
jgi:2-oxoglutarate ferredoxin oxidoreductase subunit delta